MTLKFQDLDEAVKAISPDSGYVDALFDAYLQWALVEPAHWPQDSHLPGHKVLARVARWQLDDIYVGWRNADDAKAARAS
ncbi:hypothetical protein [Mycobacterium sp. MAA66]|uniref:hypothetical protein n=1 Tax=Mycobacterium sp. MAA66 TaxID=3156297 RepID=UPI003512DFFF